jgi:hypothetical protein
MMIKNLAPRLPERGKVKIGAKGKMVTSRQGNEFQPPVKLDHFRITTLERGPDGNFLRDEEFHRRFGEKPTEIPVRLLYDEPGLNFPTRYACFIGRTLWCSGDGEFATRLSPNAPRSRKELEELRPAPHEVKCPCFRQDPAYQGRDKCKINGNLSVIIEGASGLGGVWNFRTTSYNSVIGLLSSMTFIRQVTGGPLANIPLKLRLQPKQATAPTDGSQVLIYVVGIEYTGDVAQLQQIGHQIALDRATTHLSIKEIETEARRMLALTAPTDAPLPGDDIDDVVEEFYPEQVATDQPPPRPQREDFVDTEGGDTQQQFEPFRVVFDGEIREFPEVDAACAALQQAIEEGGRAEGDIGVERAWRSNARLISEFRESGLDEEADGLATFYARALAAAQETNPHKSVPAESAASPEKKEKPSLFPPQDTHPPGTAADRSPDPQTPIVEDPPPASAPVPQKAERGGGTDWLGYIAAVTAWAAGVDDWQEIGKFRVEHAQTLEGLRLFSKPARGDLLQALAERERILRGGAP